MSPKSVRPSRSPRGPPLARLAFSISIILTASSMAGCATRASTKEIQTVAASAANLKVEIPALAQERCEAAELPPAPSPGEADYQVFGLRQTAQLEKCDYKRAVGVAAMQIHNRYVDRLVEELRPPTLWQRLAGKRPRDPPKPSLEDAEVGDFR